MIPPRLLRRSLAVVSAGIVIYVALAYLVIPTVWRVDTDLHPALAGAPRITRTSAGIHGDPLNVALVATQTELVKAMQAAGWHPADPISLETSLRIAESTIFHRPYVDAPVSNLYLWGRKEDLAFEQPVGEDPRTRHHVRFWRSVEVDAGGRPLWIGSATFDRGVGLSHTTGQITHHIAPDIDTERDKLMQDLQRAGQLSRVYWITDFQKVLQGRNGGGDPYYTDGRLAVGMLMTRG